MKVTAQAYGQFLVNTPLNWTYAKLTPPQVKSPRLQTVFLLSTYHKIRLLQRKLFSLWEIYPVMM